MAEYVILTDENDLCIGKMEKMLVHELGLLHRAFSVFIFNSQGEILLQQRAINKYHSGGLWSNTCCSHPRFMEKTDEAVERRLHEEMGITCDTTFAFSFMYKVSFENGLIENEFDHVYFGITDNIPAPNEAEVSNWKYMNLSELKVDIEQHPGNYSEWLKICLPMLMDHFKDNFIQYSSKFYEQVSI